MPNLRLGGPTAPQPSDAADTGADLQQLEKLRLTEKPPLPPLRGVHSSVASRRSGNVGTVGAADRSISSARAATNKEEERIHSLVDSTGKFEISR